MSSRSLAPVALSVVVVACAGEGPITPAPQPEIAKLASATATLSIDAGGKIVLSRAGEPLLTIEPDGLALGTLGAVTDEYTYDPTPMLVPSAFYQPFPDLTWERPLRAERITLESGHAAVRLVYADRSATLDVRAAAPDRFDLELVPDHAETVAFIRLGANVDHDEGLYGLGEWFDDVNQRGKIRAMQLELDGSIESSNNEAHVPIPMLLGTRGWGVFVDDPHPAVFDVGSTTPDRVFATFGTGVDSKSGLAFHLFVAERPVDLTRHYYDLTGYPRLPATWALGPLVWRDENTGEAQFVGDLDHMRDLDLPATGVWIDRPYATGVNTFDFKPEDWADPDAMIAHAHQLGFRMGLWHVPYLDEKDPSTASLRAQASELGAYPSAHGISLNPWGVPIDLTNPDAKIFWQEQVGRYTSHGIEGFKLDYAEDVLPGLTSLRIPWEFADGSDERTMHGRYQLFYHATYAELLPEGGGLLLCRHATIRDQTNGPIIWPGDLDASFAKHREQVTETNGDSYVAVGGLPASVVAGLGLGPSGFPFYGADTGGYRHSPPDKELFTRWFEQTALSTVMQIGNSASTVAWEPDAATGYDAEMLGWYRAYTRLHLRLFPYEWTLATRLAKDGRAIQRPLGFAFPELGVHPNDEYMFGDDLLVAPVLERGVTTRAVIFPSGRWVDFFTGEAIAGPVTKDVNAPLDVLPLYLRESAIVPMLRPTIDTLSPTTEPDRVDSFATSPGVLYVRVVPGPASSFDVFDGTSLAESDGDAVELSIEPGALFTFGAVFELAAFGGEPTAVTSDGVPLVKVDPTAIDGAAGAYALHPNGTLSVHVGPGAHALQVTR